MNSSFFSSLSPQAQQDFPLSANISMAEAEAAADAARHWMQLQNAERSGGKIHDSYSFIDIVSKHFQPVYVL